MTLNDTKTAVNKLHRVVNVIIGIVIVIIWLLILGIATTKFLLFLSSQLLLVAFVFGNTCKTVFEAIVFLFVMHPYDVGDRCEIDGVQVDIDITCRPSFHCSICFHLYLLHGSFVCCIILLDGCGRDEHLDDRVSEV